MHYTYYKNLILKYPNCLLALHKILPLVQSLGYFYVQFHMSTLVGISFRQKTKGLKPIRKNKLSSGFAFLSSLKASIDKVRSHIALAINSINHNDHNSSQVDWPPHYHRHLGNFFPDTILSLQDINCNQHQGKDTKRNEIAAVQP